MLASEGMIKGLILEGGEHSGMLPLTLNTPKPLLPIGNIPLLLYQIHQFKKAGITEIILSLSYQPRKVRDVFGDGGRFGVVLRYVVESTPVGTAGAVKKAAHLIDDTVVVINGDILCETPIRRIIEFHRAKKSQLTVAAAQVENPRPYGAIEIGKGDRVKAFREKPRGRTVASNSINAGIYVLETTVLDEISADVPTSFETDIFPRASAGGSKFYAASISEYWVELTRPDNYLKANLDFLDGRLAAPEFAAMPKQHHPPSDSTVNCVRSFIDEGCTIKAGARIEHSVVGSNCRIEEDVYLRNSVVWPGARLEKSAFISGSVLGRVCQIGESSRLTKGSLFGDRSVLTGFSRS